MYSFAGKVVWVTGSSTGIGREAALEFAKHGANVVVHCYRSMNEAQTVMKEIESIGSKALLVTGDVSSKSEVDLMVTSIKEKFGKIDILINNAGALIKRVRLEGLDEQLWDRVMNVNLKSVYLVTKSVLPLMKANNGGKIINVTSVAARNGGAFGSIAYATAKAGVSNLTRALAKDLAEYNIYVNAIAPGIITTPFHDQFSTIEHRNNQASKTPLKREGLAKEAVGAALFLASDYASFITGEIIEVNGGLLMD